MFTTETQRHRENQENRIEKVSTTPFHRVRTQRLRRSQRNSTSGVRPKSRRVSLERWGGQSCLRPAFSRPFQSTNTRRLPFRTQEIHPRGPETQRKPKEGSQWQFSAISVTSVSYPRKKRR